MTLTDEGRRFYEEVGPHLDGIEQAATRAPFNRSIRDAIKAWRETRNECLGGD
jgi:DNA-binding transcriptional LysR family regulator